MKAKARGRHKSVEGPRNIKDQTLKKYIVANKRKKYTWK